MAQGKQQAPPFQFIEILHWTSGGLNQSTRRSAINDEDFWWIENYFPLATGELRAAWGPGPPIYQIQGDTILRIFTANINGTPYLYVFLASGLVQCVPIPPATGPAANLGRVWQPVAPYYWADLKLWRPTFVGATAGQSGGLLIGSPEGYYAWDGNTITAPGSPAPLWLTNGATTDASGNPITMPSGLPGIYALEVYNQRMWVMGQTVISFSGPSNGALFDTADGGGSFGYFGDQLTYSYTDLAATAGFMYIFGDSNIDWINNVQLVGQAATGTSASTSPYTTEFQLSNYNPQIGHRFYRGVGKWLQAITVFDNVGAYVITGDGSTTWTSEKISNTWMTLNATALQGTIAPVHVFGQRWLLYNAIFTDPWGVARNMLLCWNGQIWTVCTQRYNLTNITYYEQNSTIQAFGTDGSAVYQLFAQPDPALEKRIATKSFNGRPATPLLLKNWKRAYVHLQDLSSTPEGAFLTGTMRTRGGGVPNGSEDVSFEVPPGEEGLRPYPVQGQGITAELDLRSTSPDYTIQRIMLAYQPITEFGA